MFAQSPSRAQPRAKIVCTLGPARCSDATIGGLISAGMNVARINFSHGSHEEHSVVIARVRSQAAAHGCPIAILGDLQGPRIRIGELPGPRKLETGSDVVLTPEGDATGDEVPVTYAALASDLREGDRVLINDGLLELVVLDVSPPRVTARVVHGGELTSHKGMNLPGVRVSAPALTEKDRADVAFALEQDFDYLDFGEAQRLIDALRVLDLEAVRRLARNDFQPPIEAAFPAIADVRRRLDDAGASACLLCGSGSCVAGLFDSVDAARDGAGRLVAHDGEWVCATGFAA